MKLLPIFALLLCGCSTFYERGQKVASIGSNVTGFRMTTPAGTVIEAGSIDNAIIHKTIGGAIGQGAISVGTAIATSGIVPAVK